MSNDSWKPNLFVAGFAKSGSTALVDYLNQHPDIFVPKKKEPYTLSRIEKNPLWIRNPFAQSKPQERKLSFDEYKKLYLNATNYKYRVDGSQAYTFEKGFAEYLKSFSNDAKVLLIIREQKKRAISAYIATYHGHLTDFKAWLESYLLKDIDSFLTYQQVVEYYKVFNDKLRVIKNEELNKEPKIIMNNIFSYLGLESIDVKPIVSNPSLVVSTDNSPRKSILNLAFKSFKIVRNVSEPLGLDIALTRKAKKLKNTKFVHNLVNKGIDKNRVYKSYLELMPRNIAEILDNDYNKTIEFIEKNDIVLNIK